VSPAEITDHGNVRDAVTVHPVNRTQNDAVKVCVGKWVDGVKYALVERYVS
jgi:hypothetical protein